MCIKMNKFIKFLICIVIVLLIATGCENKKDNEGLKVIVTNFPAYDFTRAVAGDNIKIGRAHV